MYAVYASSLKDYEQRERGRERLGALRNFRNSIMTKKSVKILQHLCVLKATTKFAYNNVRGGAGRGGARRGGAGRGEFNSHGRASEHNVHLIGFCRQIKQ